MPAVTTVFVVGIGVALHVAARLSARLFGMVTFSVGTLLVFMKGMLMGTLWLSWLACIPMAMIMWSRRLLMVSWLCLCNGLLLLWRRLSIVSMGSLLG
jgi:hypothetical protein